jgi:L-ascorbate metabolism protein UlaG (beta-lactamase superfamily)
MKVTKYPQSCLVIEKDGKRLVIDPGSLVSAAYKSSDLLPVDLILITHEHIDHVDPALLDEMLATKKVPVYGNESTAKALGNRVTNIIKDGEMVSDEGFSITARELPHVLMVNGSEGPQNTGFVIDGTFFHSGDGIELDGLTVDTAAIPIAGPDISPKDVYSFIKQLGCHTVIPIHYDYFIANPEMLNNDFVPGVKAVILKNGESAEI